VLGLKTILLFTQTDPSFSKGFLILDTGVTGAYLESIEYVHTYIQPIVSACLSEQIATCTSESIKAIPFPLTKTFLSILEAA
jgi:hypothetical protein